MALVWNQLRPTDRYRVQLANSLSLFQIKIVTHLYQPLMGPTAHSLYLTLLSEVDGEQHFSADKNHQWLMNIMGSALDHIYRARLRLEALGLLKTYTMEKGSDQMVFEYEVFSPLSPSQFFEDDILSICLYNQVGTTRYKELRARYSSYLVSPRDNEIPAKKEITKEFHEVFTSIHPSELVAINDTEMQHELYSLAQQFPLPNSKENEITNQPRYQRYKIDTDALKSFLMKGLKTESILKTENLHQMRKAAYFYQFDEWTLSRLIHDSLTIDDELDLSLFREKAKEWYRLQEGGKPPRVIHKAQPISQRVITEEEVETEEDRHLFILESISPLNLLEEYQGGGKVAEADLKVVEELLFDYQLSPSVVNVLVEYIYLTNNFKLPKNLVTKVAAHWKRLKITDIKQAQELAKREHQQYKQWQEKAKESKSTDKDRKSYTQKTNVRKDTLPPWIEEQVKQDTHVPQREPQTELPSSISDQQKRERMEHLLKALGEWDKKGGE
jgi:replication initiation and membrane attachment protein